MMEMFEHYFTPKDCEKILLLFNLNRCHFLVKIVSDIKCWYCFNIEKRLK